MEAICIETENTDPERLRRCLLKQVETWQSNGLLQEFNETCKGPVTIWDCKVVSDGQATNLRKLAAQVLADYIISEIEPALLDKLAVLHHPNLGERERGQVTGNVRQRLLREEMLTGESRRRIILRNLEEFLQSQDQINIEGFIRFRLQDYQRELLELINQSADDLAIEKEYQDFINLLKYFVEIQQPRFPEMHLMCVGKGMVLCDDNFKVLHREKEQSIEGADAVVSTLVTAAPNTVTIHINNFPGDSELLSTIRHIFDSKVKMCFGCEHCRSEK